MCGLLGRSKQSFYKYQEVRVMERHMHEEMAVDFAREVRAQDPQIGGTKIWLMSKKEFPADCSIGRDRFLNLIDRNELKIRQRSRKPRTTDSTHGLPVYPDLTKRLIPQRINQLWASDITYISIQPRNGPRGFCFLSLVLDAYSEEIIGWGVGPTLATCYPIHALKMALLRLKDVPNEQRHLIHHSDRGVQYASAQYIRLLKDNNIQVSMTESGDPKDNAKAERINNTVKNELFKGQEFGSIREVKEALQKAVSFYNERRPHMSLDMMTPREAAQMQGSIKKRWHSYKEDFIRREQNNLRP